MLGTMDEPAPASVETATPTVQDPLLAVLAKLDERARGYDAPREWIQNLSPAARSGLSCLN